VPGSRTPSSNSTPFADRLAALVEERRSQICLGLDPVPDVEPWSSASSAGAAGEDPRARAAAAVVQGCAELIERAGSACVAIKPQLARFEALGAPGWAALERVCDLGRTAGLLVVADGKRGDVPVSAEAYAAALVGSSPTPWGDAPGLGADAFTANPLLGRDSLEPLLVAAELAGAGVFTLVRTSNPGAADLLDLETGEGPVHEHLARLVAGFGGRLMGDCGLSGVGAVVGATEPRYIARLRELMPSAVFLLPGVGAQGGRSEELAPAFTAGPASALVTASRSLAGAADPAAAAENLREAIWSLSGGRAGSVSPPPP
jgi:orotidine-5'-phosphate decarboxylase